MIEGVINILRLTYNIDIVNSLTKLVELLNDLINW
jgi:hypothetical protein